MDNNAGPILFEFTADELKKLAINNGNELLFTPIPPDVENTLIKHGFTVNRTADGLTRVSWGNM